MHAGSMADYCIKKEARNVMIARAAMIHSTIDFGRPYSDVVQKRGYWVMEELLQFTETWSVMIFQPYKKGSAIIPILHDKDTLEMWQSFRVIVHHFMRSFAENASDAACDKVALHLRRYSQGVEKVFGPSQCKYNMHHVVCRQASCQFVLPACLCVCVSAFLPACLPLCMYLLACLCVCVCVCVCVSACLSACMSACLPASLSVCGRLSVCVSACLSLCVTVYTTYICLFCCRALDQQRARGLTAEESEFWIENCIQLCKSSIKHCCSREPKR